MFVEQIVDGIIDGEFEREELNKIIKAIKTRRGIEDTMKTARFSKGDYATFNSRSNPAYLCGSEVSVVKVNKKTVAVDFPYEDHLRGYSGAKNVKVPISMLDKSDV